MYENALLSRGLFTIRNQIHTVEDCIRYWKAMGSYRVYPFPSPEFEKTGLKWY